MKTPDAMTFRHSDVTVTVTVGAGQQDPHAHCRLTGPQTPEPPVWYPRSWADLVLPVAEPAERASHVRKGLGTVWQSGTGLDRDSQSLRGVPFGITARHFVMFMCTEAMSNGGRIVLSPHRVYAFLASLGSLSEAIGKTYFADVADQLSRISGHSYTRKYSGGRHEACSFIYSHYRDDGEGYLDSSADCPAVITLSSTLAAQALDFVALERAAVRKFSRHSCTAVDVYAWLAKVARSLNDHEHHSWEEVHARFGDEHPDGITDEFKTMVGRHLLDAAAVVGTVITSTDESGASVQTTVRSVDVLHDVRDGGPRVRAR